MVKILKLNVNNILIYKNMNIKWRYFKDLFNSVQQTFENFSFIGERLNIFTYSFNSFEGLFLIIYIKIIIYNIF